jgi:hypothetical protein
MARGGIAAVVVSFLLAGCATTLAGIIKDGKSVAAGEAEVAVNQKRVTGRLPMALDKGDEIVTDSNSTAIIRFASGDEVFLRPNSTIRISSIECSKACELFVKIKTAVRDAKDAFRVSTEYVTAGAAGTAFYVRHEPGRETTVITTEGRVSLRPTAGKWESVVLEAGQRGVVKDVSPPKIDKATKPELEDLHKWVEEAESLAPKWGLTTGQILGTAAAAAAIGAIILSSDDDDDDDRPRQGWCCARSVYPATREQCASAEGRYYNDERSARAACVRPGTSDAPGPRRIPRPGTSDGPAGAGTPR